MVKEEFILEVSSLESRGTAFIPAHGVRNCRSNKVCACASVLEQNQTKCRKLRRASEQGEESPSSWDDFP